MKKFILGLTVCGAFLVLGNDVNAQASTNADFQPKVKESLVVKGENAKFKGEVTKVTNNSSDRIAVAKEKMANKKFEKPVVTRKALANKTVNANAQLTPEQRASKKAAKKASSDNK